MDDALNHYRGVLYGLMHDITSAIESKRFSSTQKRHLKRALEHLEDADIRLMAAE